MKTLKIENKQASAKWKERTVNLPDWLLSGDHAAFRDDQDINQEKAFKAVCSYCMQHLPVAFRSKDIKQTSGYEWLDGKMQGHAAVSVEECKTYLIETRSLDANKINALTDARIKAMYKALMDVAGLEG